MNTFNSFPEFVNCTFENNFASGDGGAVAGYGIFTNCMFIGNEANFSSGAIDGGGTITNCTFENNWAYTQGGAMSFGSGALIDCTFQDNYAADGGAISIPEYGHPLIDRCVFKNNIAERGGAIYSWGGQPVVQNSIFDSNGTPLCHGGVFYLEYYGDRERDYIINISNCLMVNNLNSF